jgi:hypothetical protein
MPAAIPFITSENAAAIAKLSWEKRRARALELKNNPPAEPVMLPIAPDALKNARTQVILELIEHQIDVTSAKLNSTTPITCEKCGEVIQGEISPRDRALLLGALDRLLERERVYRQIAGPGNLKPTSQRQRSGPPTPTV